MTALPVAPRGIRRTYQKTSIDHIVAGMEIVTDYNHFRGSVETARVVSVTWWNPKVREQALVRLDTGKSIGVTVGGSLDVVVNDE